MHIVYCISTVCRVVDGVVKATTASVATRADAGSKPLPWVAFFFGQVTVSGTSAATPPPGHVRYLRVPNKKSAKPKTQVFSKLTISSQLMTIDSFRALRSIIKKKKKKYYINNNPGRIYLITGKHIFQKDRMCKYLLLLILLH